MKDDFDFLKNRNKKQINLFTPLHIFCLNKNF